MDLRTGNKHQRKIEGLCRTMIRIGDIEIELINDARVWADSGGVFGLVPRVLWSKVIDADSQNRVPMDHHCLLVRAASKIMVVDTGIGYKLTEKQIARMGLERAQGGLIEGLARHGVKPEDVQIVINTHLHSDHSGGNTHFEGETIVPAFPNAEYWVQRLEYADAAFPNERTRGTYFPENFASLYASGQMKLLDGESDVVPGIRCVVTPGHTRGHQSIVFESNHAAALYTGDMSTLGVHFTNLAWMTAYDVEPLITLETKRYWQRWALEKNALLIFVHEAQVPVGRVVRENEKLRIDPVTG
jgi:glyoxylase-like metal-dependent hydrolase (beta-lactamase superfamily II)